MVLASSISCHETTDIPIGDPLETKRTLPTQQHVVGLGYPSKVFLTQDGGRVIAPIVFAPGLVSWEALLIMMGLVFRESVQDCRTKK